MLGHPLGLAARLTAALVSGGLAVLTLRFIENPLRFAGPIRRSGLASLALGGVATAIRRSAWAWCCWNGFPLRSAAARQLRRYHRGDSARRRQHRRLRRSGAKRLRPGAGRGRGRSRAEAVPSNLNPPLAEAAAEAQAYLLNGCLRTPFQGGQPECATGDTASPTTVALVGELHAAMWKPAFQEVAAKRHWRLEMLGRASSRLMDLPIADRLFTGLVEGEHCGQWRGRE